MVDVQVVLNAGGVSAEELAASVSSLLPSVDRLEVAHTDVASLSVLSERFGAAVGPLDSLRPDLPLLVVPARVAFAFGAVRRLVSHTQVPGRCVTRVFLPELSEAEHLACWSSSFLRLYDGSLSSLVNAGVSFDRRHLSHSSPRARSWLPAHSVGVAMVSDTGDDLERWSRRTGVTLDARRVWGSAVRGPAGGVRRRLVRRRHRRGRGGAARSVR